MFLICFYPTIPFKNVINVNIFIENYPEEYVPKIISGYLWGMVYIIL